jgi:hypothetical protein
VKALKKIDINSEECSKQIFEMRKEIKEVRNFKRIAADKLSDRF